jgi:hypothetical protein
LLEGKEESLLWLKYKFFEEGIGPREFRKCQMRDIKEIMEIKNAVEERRQRESDIQDALSRMGRF